MSVSKPVFDKILVANRGEIACRIMRTAHKMGIETVAVYSDADRGSEHVKMATQAVHIGASPSAESYLVQERITEAMLQTGAQAVHPGYGFLSENRVFSQAVEDIGCTFIGPDANAILKMGDKIESMNIAEAAGVSTAPRYSGEVHTVEHALELAKDIGYPIIMKASSGGGGKGMRVAWNDEEMIEGFVLARDEAVASFGDPRMLIQHFVCPHDGRHIEIQVLGDKHGNYLALNERECSIQRRHQKIIEEAPSPFVSPEMRKAMGDQAKELAAAVNYSSAGTVEFLVDPQTSKWYFLEMNTRLQVEHPITEHITGVDLVEQMIRVAAGEKLTMKQEDVPINGWAIESRVYAEDSVNYLPSTGRLSTYIEPVASNPDAEWPDVRVDSGVVEGSEISVYYDPMICKLITHGKDRNHALQLMRDALDNYVIKGLEHNIPLLRDAICQETFISGDTTTEFLNNVYPDKFIGYQLDVDEESQLVASAVVAYVADQLDMLNFNELKNIPAIQGDLVVTLGKGDDKKLCEVTLISATDGVVEMDVAGKKMTVESSWFPGQPLLKANINDKQVVSQFVNLQGSTWSFRFCGTVFDLAIRTAHDEYLNQHLPERVEEIDLNAITTPMPGVCISIAVQPGDEVAAGQTVAVVEAMKMQNNLVSPRSGIVKAVYVAAGESIENEAVLIELEEEADDEEEESA